MVSSIKGNDFILFAFVCRKLTKLVRFQPIRIDQYSILFNNCFLSILEKCRLKTQGFPEGLYKRKTPLGLLI